MDVTDTKAYLNPSMQNFEDVNHYDNLDKAVEYLKRPYKYIYILQDVDVDGICSSAIIYQWIKEYFKVQPLMLFHQDKMHGIDDTILNILASNAENSLLIIPDASVNTEEYAYKLAQYHIDVICLDHHNTYINTDNVISVNNQYGTVVNKALSGAGVTHKFCQYLDTQYGTNIAEKYYDLVALSVVSDSCDVRSMENRAYIKFGLQNLTNPFFKFLCNNLIKTEITPHELSFKIINLLNAVCRSDNEELKILLFKCFVGEYDNYETVLSLCKKAKTAQDEKVKEVIDTTDIINSDNLVVMLTDGVDAISGLIANKLQTKYLKPAFVLHEKDGEYVGSVRSPIGIREMVSDNPLFTFNQGHSAAYGTSFPIENLQKIIQYFDTLNLEDAKKYNVIGSYNKNISSDLFTKFNDYEMLWAQGLNRPLIHYHCSCKGSDWQSLKGATIKLVHNNTTFIKFFVSNQQKELWHIGDNKTYDIDIIGYCSLNEWNNKTTNQVIIEELIVTEKTIY